MFFIIFDADQLLLYSSCVKATKKIAFHFYNCKNFIDLLVYSIYNYSQRTKCRKNSESINFFVLFFAFDMKSGFVLNIR